MLRRVMILNCYFKRREKVSNVLLIKYHYPLQLYSCRGRVTFIITDLEFESSSLQYGSDYIEYGPYKLYKK